MQNSQENTYARVSLLIRLQAIKREALAQVFSCEFSKFFKNTFFTEHLRTIASILSIAKGPIQDKMGNIKACLRSLFKTLLKTFDGGSQKYWTASSR